MLVIIKGNIKEAQEAARTRKITSFDFYRYNPKFNETYGHVPDDDFGKVIKWFSEEIIETGSCLWYRS